MNQRKRFQAEESISAKSLRCKHDWVDPRAVKGLSEQRQVHEEKKGGMPFHRDSWKDRFCKASSSTLYCTCNCTYVCQSLSHVPLFATPWTVAHQAPQSMEFSRQECWSGLLFPSPGDIPNPGIESRSPPLQSDSLPSEPPGKPIQAIGSLQRDLNRVI